LCAKKEAARDFSPKTIEKQDDKHTSAAKAQLGAERWIFW
jgi:hypothetical protein